MQLTLTEYQTLPGVALNPLQLSALQEYQVKLKLQIAPSRGQVGCFDIKASSIVGVVEWPKAVNLRLTIKPKLPLSALFFLLAYTQAPRFYESLWAGFAEEDELHEMLARCFKIQAERILRRGLLQGYRTEADALQVVRGRIDFATQLRREYGRMLPVHCIYQDFSEDVPENQLLLAVVDALRRFRFRDSGLKRELNQIEHRLGVVSRIPSWRQAWAAYVPSRLNVHYRAALALGRQILLACGLSQDLGELDGISFQVDMNKAVEDFVVVALREALHLDERRFPQNAARRPLYLDVGERIKLEPDLSWWEGPRCLFVGDVKYKRTDRGHASNPDVYQMLAYCEATGLDRGLLIYGDSEHPPAHYRMAGSSRIIEIAALQLAAPPQELLEQIQILARQIETHAASI